MHAHGTWVDEMVSETQIKWRKLGSLHITDNNDVVVSVALGMLVGAMQLCPAAHITEKWKG